MHQLSDTDYPVPSSLQGAKCVYKGVRFDVCSLEIKCKDGQSKQRDAILHPGAVVILPIMDEHTIVMIQNERFVVGERLWELPAGTLEPNEAPIETAKRELIEETGFEAESMKPIMHFYTTPGICTEKMYAFVAESLSFVGQNLDAGEDITVEQVSWVRALQMIRDGDIRDAKTIAVLSSYALFYKN